MEEPRLLTQARLYLQAPTRLHGPDVQLGDPTDTHKVFLCDVSCAQVFDQGTCCQGAENCCWGRVRHCSGLRRKNKVVNHHQLLESSYSSFTDDQFYLPTVDHICQTSCLLNVSQHRSQNDAPVNWNQYKGGTNTDRFECTSNASKSNSSYVNR